MTSYCEGGDVGGDVASLVYVDHVETHWAGNMVWFVKIAGVLEGKGGGEAR